MSPVTIVLLVILAVLIIGLIVLYFLGKKAQKKKAEQDEQLAAAAQTVSMLIIDKKRMRITESGLPQVVIDQTPKMMRRTKLPIVKAKVGPKVMSLIADESVFDYIPVKKEVKATVSGIYITKVTGVRGPLEKPEGKKSWRTKLKEKANVKIAFAVFFISSIFYIIHTGIYLCTLFLLSHYATAPSLLPASVFLPYDDRFPVFGTTHRVFLPLQLHRLLTRRSCLHLQLCASCVQ